MAVFCFKRILQKTSMIGKKQRERGGKRRCTSSVEQHYLILQFFSATNHGRTIQLPSKDVKFPERMVSRFISGISIKKIRCDGKSAVIKIPGLRLDNGFARQIIPGSIEADRWYDIKVEVKGGTVKAYLDGKLIQEISTPNPKTNSISVSAARDERSGRYYP